MKHLTDMINAINPPPGGADPGQRNPLTLAYIGDVVYDLFIRTYLVENFDEHVHSIHMRAVSFVRCHEQADTIKRIMDTLTPGEAAVYRRGRNAKSGTVPANADIGEYHMATGFEAVLGYLYLKGDTARLMELLGLALDIYIENSKEPL